MTVHFNEITDEAVGIALTRSLAQPDRPGGLYRLFGKRAFDLLAVILTAPVVVPVVLILALLVAIDGGKPFFTQRRVGRGNREFRILKLRTMVVDAEARLAAHLASDASASAEWAAHQKLMEDPRVTWLGRFLRRTSMDELPQLWNVFLGDMSLVGPRPMMLEQRAMYPGSAYYHLRPGITGPWQVSDRNMVEFRGRAVFDQRYYHDLSLPTDLRLLARTVRAVLRCTGH
ncbi:MAG: sugar transferase [Rhodobacteraceae bacterium]|nr:sugar transferase [Paracoccaceae bacterium]